MNRKNFLTIIGLLLLSFTGMAQKPVVGCIDRSVRLQADEIKRHYTDQGFTVYRDAMINMESMVPSQVMLELQRGKTYLVVFVGHPAAQRMNLEVWNSDDHKIGEKSTARNREQPNYIIYNITPASTDAYLIIVMQKLKQEHMCGSISILGLETNGKEVAIKPYQ